MSIKTFATRTKQLTPDQMKAVKGGDNSDYCESILAIMNGPNGDETIKKAEELWDKHCVPTGPEV